MAITTRGFQGTVSDVDMATQLPQIPGCVLTPTDLAVTAVAGNRRVSIAAGSAVAHFVKVTSDAAITIDLTPPASGGKWYAIAIDREWSPTNTATFVAVDTGVTTDGSVQTSIAACLTQGGATPSALAWQKQNPGTSGSTAASGHHQVLAFVHVRAADTTLQVFGTRLIGGGAGAPFAESIHALAWHAQAAGGGRANKLTVGPHLIGGEQVQAIEAVGNGFGGFVLTGRIYTGNPATLAGLGAGLRTILNAYQGVARVYGENTSPAKVGLSFLDTGTTFTPEWTWAGADWELAAGYVTVATGVNGGIGLPGTVVNFANGSLDCYAQRTGKSITFRLMVNVGSNGIAVGGLVASLPAGFRPSSETPFVADLYDQGGTGWAGQAANVTVKADGSVVYQGQPGRPATDTVAANKGIFGTFTFRVA